MKKKTKNRELNKTVLLKQLILNKEIIKLIIVNHLKRE